MDWQYTLNAIFWLIMAGFVEAARRWINRHLEALRKKLNGEREEILRRLDALENKNG